MKMQQKPPDHNPPSALLTSRPPHHKRNNILEELQLLRCCSSVDARGKRGSNDHEDNNFETETHLKLSIGSCSNSNNRIENIVNEGEGGEGDAATRSMEVGWLKESASEELKLAMAEKAYAEEARREAKREIEMAEVEFGRAKRIRKEAKEELEKAEALKKQAMMKMSSTLLQITCQACKQQFQSSSSMVGFGVSSEETSLVMSYMSSPATEGDGE